MDSMVCVGSRILKLFVVFCPNPEKEQIWPIPQSKHLFHDGLVKLGLDGVWLSRVLLYENCISCPKIILHSDVDSMILIWARKQ